MAFGATGASARPVRWRSPRGTDDQGGNAPLVARREDPARPSGAARGGSSSFARRSRRALAALVAAPVLVAALAAPAQAAKRPELTARAAFLIETQTGEVVYSKRADQRLPIASTTKIMTALTALDRLQLTDTVSAVPYRSSVGESRLGLRSGERMTVADLMRAMMLPSANDGAATLAKAASGTRSAFIRAMNDKAAKLRLTHTHFSTPVGLDTAGNYSSARELATMARALLRHPFLKKVVDRPTATLESGDRKRTIVNRNTLVRQVSWMSGVKTGHTGQAGYVLVGSAQRRGVRLISVVLGTPSEAARDADTMALMRYGLARYRRATVFKRGRVLAKATIKYRRGAELTLAAGRTLRLVGRRGTRYRLHVVGAPSEVEGPIRAGQKMGTVEVYEGRRRVAVVPLVAATSIAEAGVPLIVKDYFTRPLTLVLVAIAIVATVQVVFLRRRAGRLRRTGQEVETTA